MDIELLINCLAIYLLVSFLFLSFVSKSSIRIHGIAILNIVFCVYGFFCKDGVIQWHALMACVTIIALSYCALKYAPNYFLAIIMPILALIMAKTHYLPSIIGISYLTFRLSYLAYEVQMAKVVLPTPLKYVGYAFFPLIFFIGPISPYHLYESSLDRPDRSLTPIIRALGRILIGMIKLLFLAQLFKTMTFAELWFDGYYHGLSDFIVSCIFSYLYLYFNFSGACDMIIGAAGILNIRVAENFANPLMARNIRIFWSRFHMTLTNYMREIFFMPGVLKISRITGPRWINLNIVILLSITFIIIGLWHGNGINFLILGVLHAMGMICFFLYTIAWKHFSPPIKILTETAPMRFLSWLLTFLYVSFTSLFFANDWMKIKEIYQLFLL